MIIKRIIKNDINPIIILAREEAQKDLQNGFIICLVENYDKCITIIIYMMKIQ